MRFFRRIPDIAKGIMLYAALTITALLVFFVAEQYIPYSSPQPAPSAQASTVKVEKPITRDETFKMIAGRLAEFEAKVKKSQEVKYPEPIQPYTPAPTEHKASFAVKVVLAGGHGSGVHIGDGLILTNSHVAGAMTSVKLKADDGSEQDAEVLWNNASRDVALLLASQPDKLDSVHLSCRDLDDGELLTSYGNPTNIEFITIKGRVAGKARDMGPWKSVVPVDMTIIPGMSGGPVMDAAGDLVGLNVGVMPVQIGMGVSLSGIGYIIPSSTICLLLGRV